MSGLHWMSYTSGGSLDAGYNTYNQLYANAVAFFSSPSSQITTGGVTTLQLISNGYCNPAFTTFSLGPTTNVAIQFSGYFCPDKTGDWTIHLGNGASTPCDDFGILFLGVPNGTIIPNSTFTTDSNVPSNTLPFLHNLYNTSGNSKTVTLQAGVSYPLLIYYNQGRYSYTFGLAFSYNGGDLITDFTDITSLTPHVAPVDIACFKEGAKILTDRGYKSIEQLKCGDMVQTALSGYKAIVMIGKKEMGHIATTERIENQLYVCSQKEYSIMEDLVLTGCHSILVDEFQEEQREKTIELLGDIYITENKYRLPACLDKRALVYEPAGTYTIYHLALENDDYYMNYGIYANGLLVESCSKRYLKEISEMELQE